MNKFLKLLLVLVGLPLSACAEPVMVGDIEISATDFLSQLSPEQRIAKCLACHGDRAGGDIDFGPDVHFGTPALRGLRENYLRDSLLAYKNGSRSHEEMSVVSSLLDEETIEFMAKTISLMEIPAARSAQDIKSLAETDVLFSEGQSIALKGVPGKGIPACMTCHGPQGEGSVIGPRLAGQNVMYIESQFEAFSDGSRKTSQSAAMLPAVSGLAEEEIRVVAYYYSLLTAISVSGN